MLDEMASALVDLGLSAKSNRWELAGGGRKEAQPTNQPTNPTASNPPQSCPQVLPAKLQVENKKIRLSQIRIVKLVHKWVFERGKGDVKI